MSACPRSVRPKSARPAIGLAAAALLAAAPALVTASPAPAAASAVPAAAGSVGAVPADAGGARLLFVSNRASNSISVFSADRTGRLTDSGTHFPTATAPRGVGVSADGRAVYVANSVARTVSAYTVTGSALTPLGDPISTDNGLNTFSLAVAPGGGTVYVVAHDEVNEGDLEGEGTVLVLAVGPDGGLTQVGSSVPSGAIHPRSVAVTPDGRFVFVAHGDPNFLQPGFITRFAVGAGGTLTPLGPAIPAGTSDGAMSITPDGRFLYLPAEGSNEILGYRIGADGSLTPVPGPPLSQPGSPNSTTVTPDGRHIYVTSLDTGTVTGYAVGAGGTLAPVVEVTVGVQPNALATSPDGRYLYVSNFGSSSVSVFAIQRDGGLVEIGSPVPSGGQGPAFRSLAFQPNQGPAAAFAASAGRAGRPVVFDASASSDTDGTVVRYDWDFGDGTVGTSAGPAARHAYNRAGEFTVTLRVTDDEGCAARTVYTGYAVLCAASPAAVVKHTVTIGR